MQVTIKKTQHCTSIECPYTHSHSADWCGYDQPRRCECPYDYQSEPYGDNILTTIEVPDVDPNPLVEAAIRWRARKITDVELVSVVDTYLVQRGET